MVEKPKAGAGEGDAVLIAGGGNLAGADRPTGLGDAADTVTACVIDVVTERKIAVGVNSGVSVEVVRRRLGYASTETTQADTLLAEQVADAEIRAARRRRESRR